MLNKDAGSKKLNNAKVHIVLRERDVTQGESLYC